MKFLLSIFRFWPRRRPPASFSEKIWNFLTSNLVAVWLLIILAAVSILGTVIPQREGPELYAKLYGEVFSRLFYFLGLNDLYSSPLFVLLLSLLGASISACSLKRLLSVLKKKKDLYCWGSFFAHLSVLIIYAGAVYGNAAGFSGSAAIEKGASYFEPRGNFFVRLNDFNAKFDQRGRPLLFSSDLSVIEGDKEVLRKTITVNDPLSYQGIKFYQSDYGLNGLIEISGPGGKTETMPVYKGSCATYSLTNQMFHIEEIFPDLHILHGLAAETFEPTRPIAFIIAHDQFSSRPIGWLVKGRPLRYEKYTLKLLDAKEYTGLQVRKDPGVPLIYLGFLLLTAGTGVMLYVKH